MPLNREAIDDKFKELLAMISQMKTSQEEMKKLEQEMKARQDEIIVEFADNRRMLDKLK